MLGKENATRDMKSIVSWRQLPPSTVVIGGRNTRKRRSPAVTLTAPSLIRLLSFPCNNQSTLISTQIQSILINPIMAMTDKCGLIEHEEEEEEAKSYEPANGDSRHRQLWSHHSILGGQEWPLLPHHPIPWFSLILIPTFFFLFLFILLSNFRCCVSNLLNFSAVDYAIYAR